MSAADRVVIAGHVCVDEIVTTEGRTRALGSPAAFITPVLREAGLEVQVLAPYGDDFLPVAGGLPVAGPPSCPQTLVYVNDVRGARRRQSVRHVESARIGRPGVVALDALRSARALLFTPLLPDPAPATVAEFVAGLPGRALRLVLLQGYLRRVDGAPDARGEIRVRDRDLTEVHELIPLFDVAVLSDEDLGGGESGDGGGGVDATVAGWSAAHPMTAIIVTRGPDGASFYRAGVRRDVPACPIADLPPAALVGAGDLFSAELTAALIDLAGPDDVRATAAGDDALARAVARANEATAGRLEVAASRLVLDPVS